MNSKCKNKCHRLEDTRSGNRGSFRLGFKRCGECEIFIKYDGHRCPCCNGILSSKPRSAIARRKLLEWREQNEQ